MQQWLILSALTTLLTLAPTSYGDTIRVAVGLALAPYVIAEENSGFELDIVREALASQGHTVVPIYVSFRRVPELLKLKKVQAAITVTSATVGPDAYLSKPYIRYHNVAVALAKHQLALNSQQDLAKHRILAFQNAHRYLGPDYYRSIQQSPDYQEIARQAAQVTMLFGERVDVIVLDINIFNYYRQQQNYVGAEQPVDIFPLFEPVNYQMAFSRRQWRDDFDRGIAELKRTGRYQQLIQRYLGNI
jgi:polar amino acid transport system substrate-binding protein